MEIKKRKEYLKNYSKEYRNKNKEKLIIKNREYYNKNKEIILKKNKKYYNQKEIKLKRKIYAKKYYLENKEKRKEYLNKNKEIILQKRKERYKLNVEKERENNKKYYYGNKRKINSYRNVYYKKRRQIDRNFLIKIRLRQKLSKTIKKYILYNKVGSSKEYGIDYKKIIEHLEPFPKDLSEYQIHHIKPLFTFNFLNDDGSTNLEEIKKAFAPENHVLITINEHRKIHGS